MASNGEPRSVAPDVLCVRDINGRHGSAGQMPQRHIRDYPDNFHPNGRAESVTGQKWAVQDHTLSDRISFGCEALDECFVDQGNGRGLLSVRRRKTPAVPQRNSQSLEIFWAHTLVSRAGPLAV